MKQSVDKYRNISTLLDSVESPLAGHSLFALCIAHCLQFEHSGDSTMQFKQCVNAHPVSQVRELP